MCVSILIIECWACESINNFSIHALLLSLFNSYTSIYTDS